METRAQAERKRKMEENAHAVDIPNNRDNTDFEQAITTTLEEVQKFIVTSKEENNELRNQIDNLFCVVESQKQLINRMSSMHEDQVRELEARVARIEYSMDNQDKDNNNQTELLNHIDMKLNQVNTSIERVKELEGKLKLKLSKPEGTSYRSSVKPVQLPPAYDGLTPWEAFSAQFDIIAEMNGWNMQEKASFLASSLKGNATMVLSNLPEESRRSFDLLTKALSNRFGTTHQSELARAKFKTRVKKRDESYPELVSDLERLVKLAYPGAEPELQDTLAKDQFVDAIADEETRMKVRQGRPKNIQAALEIALELESYHLADRWGHVHSRASYARQVTRLGEAAPSFDSGVESEMHKLTSMIGKVLDEVRQKGQNMHIVDRQRPQRCFNCNEIGHFKVSCPYRSSSERGLPPHYGNCMQSVPNTPTLPSPGMFNQNTYLTPNVTGAQQHIGFYHNTSNQTTMNSPSLPLQDKAGVPQQDNSYVTSSASNVYVQAPQQTSHQDSRLQSSTHSFGRGNSTPRGNYQRSMSRGRGRPS